MRINFAHVTFTTTTMSVSNFNEFILISSSRLLSNGVVIRSDSNSIEEVRRICDFIVCFTKNIAANYILSH